MGVGISPKPQGRTMTKNMPITTFLLSDYHKGNKMVPWLMKLFDIKYADDTQDTTEDEHQLNHVREWIKSYLDDVDALIEGLILKAGNKSFNIKRARVG
ncbi:hypothetical protein Tco_0327764 [Tanacetum coccineum]